MNTNWCMAQCVFRWVEVSSKVAEWHCKFYWRQKDHQTEPVDKVSIGCVRAQYIRTKRTQAANHKDVSCEINELKQWITGMIHPRPFGTNHRSSCMIEQHQHSWPSVPGRHYCTVSWVARTVFCHMVAAANSRCEQATQEGGHCLLRHLRPAPQNCGTHAHLRQEVVVAVGQLLARKISVTKEVLYLVWSNQNWTHPSAAMWCILSVERLQWSLRLRFYNKMWRNADTSSIHCSNDCYGSSISTGGAMQIFCDFTGNHFSRFVL